MSGFCQKWQGGHTVPWERSGHARDPILHPLVWYVPFRSDLLVLFLIHWSLSWSGIGQWQNPKQINWRKNRILLWASFPFFFVPLFYLPEKRRKFPIQHATVVQVGKPSSEQVLWALLLFDVLSAQKKPKPRELLGELHVSDSAIKCENGTSQISLPFWKWSSVSKKD